MERAKGSAAAAAAAADKRKESKESRIDAKQVIDDLIKSANLLEHDESEQASGLQLKDITKHAPAQWEGGGPKSVFGSVW